GRGALVAVGAHVLPGELALPAVGHEPSAGGDLVAPREDRALEAAAGRALPLGFGGQLLARPGCVGDGILVGDVGHRVALASGGGALRALGLAPERARDVAPPRAHVAEIDGPARLAEDQRP